MLDFTNFLSVNRHAIIKEGEPVTCKNSAAVAANKVFVLGVMNKTLESVVGTLFAYDIVTGSSVIHSLDASRRAEAYDVAYIIPPQFLPLVLFKEKGEWLPGRLSGVGPIPGTFKFYASGVSKVLTEMDLYFPSQAAAMANAWTNPEMNENLHRRGPRDPRPLRPLQSAEAPLPEVPTDTQEQPAPQDEAHK